MIGLANLWSIDDRIIGHAARMISERKGEAGRTDSVHAQGGRFDRESMMQLAIGPEAKLYSTVGNVAVIPIVGVMTKNESDYTRKYGGTATLKAAMAVSAARADLGVRGILLRIDSPGGSVAGTADLADAIHGARSSKRVFAQVEDIGASAAYRAASQAEKIFASRASEVGSIGTYMVIDDYSKLMEDAGIKTHVIKAGQFKGAGVCGAPILPEHLAMWQEEINAINEMFIEDVARGRGVSIDKVRAWADGRIHPAKAALALGLIDGVQGVHETLAQLQAAPGHGNNTRGTAAPATAPGSSGITRKRFCMESLP